MILAGKYEILERVGGAAITVDRARNTISGKTVYLHRLAAGSAPAAEAMKLALKYAICHPDSGVLLDVAEDGGHTYVVTDDKPEHIALLDFLPWALAGGSNHDGGAQQSLERPSLERPSLGKEGQVPQMPATAQAVGARATDSGEFLKAFDTQGEITRPAAYPAVQRPAPPPGTTPSEMGAKQPGARQTESGEFTRIFKTDLTASAKSGPNPMLSGSAKADLTISQPAPGEFTRLFDTAATGKSAGEMPSAPSSKNSGSGEFTRMFGPRDAAAGYSQSARSDLLGERPSSAPPRQPAQAASGPGEFTRIVTGGAVSGATGPAQPASTPPGPAAFPAGPSINFPVSTGAIPQVPRPPSLHVPTPPVRPQRGMSPVIVLIAAVLLAALAVIVFFIVKR